MSWKCEQCAVLGPRESTVLLSEQGKSELSIAGTISGFIPEASLEI